MAEPPPPSAAHRDAGPSGSLSTIDAPLSTLDSESGSALRVGSNFYTHDTVVTWPPGAGLY